MFFQESPFSTGKVFFCKECIHNPIESYNAIVKGFKNSSDNTVSATMDFNSNYFSIRAYYGEIIGLDRAMARDVSQAVDDVDELVDTQGTRRRREFQVEFFDAGFGTHDSQ